MKLIFTILVLCLTFAGSAFAADMDLAWSKRSNESTTCFFCSGVNVVAVDNVYSYFVGGAIEKRDASSGNIIWSTNTGSGAINTAAAVDDTGLYIAGGVGGYSGGWIIQKIDKNNGSLIWSRFVPEAVYYLSDSIADICLTGSAVYITGARVYDTSNDWVTEKRSLIDGSLIWSATRYGAHEWPSSCGVSADGNSVYVAGISWNGRYQFYTEKRNAGNGALAWADMSSNGISSAVRDLTVDNTGVYMGGYRGTSQDGYGNTTSWVQRVEKRNPVNGSIIWVKEDTAPVSTSFQNVLKLASDNTNLYKLVNSTTAGYLSFDKLDPVNGGTISNTVFSTFIGSGWMGTMSWSLFGGSFYLGGLGSETVTPPPPPCTMFCFFVPTPTPVTTYFWAMEKRSGTLASCPLPWGGNIASGTSVPAYQTSSVISPATCVSGSLTCTNGTISGTYTNQSCVVNPAPACPLPWGGSIASGDAILAYQSPSVMSPLTCTSQSRLCTSGTLAGTYMNQTCSVIPAVCPLPWGGSIASGTSVPAYQTPSVTSPATCASESRLCTNGTLVGTYMNQNCVVNPAAVCPNTVCESTAGENPLTCPQDCKVKYRTF